MRSRNMREVVTVSGKGGTGKTTVAASLAFLSPDPVVSDCDVDAANLSLLLKSSVESAEEFSAGKKAYIHEELCSGCGRCEEICRFSAISSQKVDPVSCEGCGYCMRICPQNAIEMRSELTGHIYLSSTAKGPLIHARLAIGGDNSGQLVTAVRKRTRSVCSSLERTLIITDGPPGVGCPVISSLSGADLALVVTEPTPSGIHDLERVLLVCRRLEIPAAICINKHDIDPENTDRIRSVAGSDYPIVGLIPYDDAVPAAMAKGISVVTCGGPAADTIRQIHSAVTCLLEEIASEPD